MRAVLGLAIIGGAGLLAWAILSGRYPATASTSSSTSAGMPAGQVPNPSTGGTP